MGHVIGTGNEVESQQGKTGICPALLGADIIDKDWMEGVYRYYGLQPYWTEGGFSGMEHHMMGKPVKG